MAMAGIPWWTTDIGGFFGGKTADPQFRELIVSMVSVGCFCPVFRLHGFRDSWEDVKNAGDNKVWSFGEQAYEIIKGLLFMRERLKPYVPCACCFSISQRTGPATRWEISSSSGRILAAPVTEYKRRSRAVYLPKGAEWKDAWSEKRRGTAIER